MPEPSCRPQFANADLLHALKRWRPYCAARNVPASPALALGLAPIRGCADRTASSGQYRPEMAQMIRRLTSDDAEELDTAPRRQPRATSTVPTAALRCLLHGRDPAGPPRHTRPSVRDSRRRSACRNDRALRPRARPPFQESPASATGSTTNVAAAGSRPAQSQRLWSSLSESSLSIAWKLRRSSTTSRRNACWRRTDYRHIGLAPRYLQIAGAWRDHLLFQLDRRGLELRSRVTHIYPRSTRTARYEQHGGPGNGTRVRPSPRRPLRIPRWMSSAT